MRVSYSKVGLSLLLLVPAAGVIGCSSFNRDWRAARPLPAGAPEVAGRWTGTWQSAANGHQGKLRAILTPIPEGKLDARFRAGFWGIIAYSYRLELDAQLTEPGEWALMGGADLGWLAGGEFRLEGTATTNDFRATYESKRDQGALILSRPLTAR